MVRKAKTTKMAEPIRFTTRSFSTEVIRKDIRISSVEK